MSDYQTIVENIRSQISYFGALGDDQLEPLVESYMQASQDVNARLLRCSQMIRSGNLSEAVRLADLEPDLLESYALLDFPERNQWSELVRSRGFPVPPPLFEELAREVNDAYTTVNPLQPLLKKHRFFAIARAPLSERIAVLREIVLMEPDHLDWKSDLDSYEKTRFREIENEIPAAIASKDVAKMSSLLRELDPKGWTTKPPEKLTKALRQNLKVESQRAIRVELQRLVEKLKDAYESNNIELGLKFSDQWEDLSRQFGPGIPMDWKVEVQTPLIWAEENRQQRERIREYEGMLNHFRSEIQTGSSTERLSTLFSQIEAVAEELGQQVPDSVLRVYQTKLNANEVRGNRRFRVFLVVLVSLMMLVAGGMVFSYFQMQQRRERDRIASTLQGYLDREDYDTAQQYFEEQGLKLQQYSESPGVAEVYAELKTAVERENERKILFRNSLNQARESLKNGPIDELALIQARARAKTDSEKYELRALENENRRHLAESQRRIDFSLQSELDPISARIQQLTSQRGKENDAVLEELNELLQKSMELRKTQGASHTLLNRRDQLIGQLERWIAEINQRKESRGDISDLTKTVENSHEYANTLQALMQKYSNLPMSRDFRRLLQERAVWNLVDRWNALIEELPTQRQPAGNKSGSEQNAKRIDSFLAQWTQNSKLFVDFPEKESVDYNVPYLRSLRNREKDKESLLLSLEKDFLALKARTLWMYYSEKEEARYYLIEPLKAGKNRYIIDHAGTERTVQIPDYVARTTVEEKAPQVRFAELALERLSKIDSPEGMSWRETACFLLKDLQDDAKIDPFLKFLLLKKMITVFGTGDLCVQKGYAKTLSFLDEEAPNEYVNWYDPKSEDAQLERGIAQSVLIRLPSSDSAVESTRTDAENLKKHPLEVFRRIGWAEKTEDGNWKLVSRSAEIPRNELRIVRGEEKENGAVSLRFEPISFLDPEARSIVSSPGLLFGSPIYVKVPVFSTLLD